MRDAIIANLFGLTIGEPESAVMSVLKLRGVKQCSLSIFKETVEPERPNWIDADIAKMIPKLDRYNLASLVVRPTHARSEADSSDRKLSGDLLL